MGRLIDADAFENFIKEKYKDGESTDDIKDQMLFDLSYQPTAYNVEKVVAELEKASVGAFDIQTISFRRAVDIVRKGGVDEHN